MDVIDHISNEFQASELVLIAERCGLAPVSRWDNRKLVDVIISKINRDGIPQPPKGDITKADELLEDFLYITGYTADTGEVIRTKVEFKEVAVLPLDEFMQLHGVTTPPTCYSFADDADPACKRCLFYILCAQERLANLPVCWGVLWDKTSPECGACIEQPFCKIATLKKNGA